MAKILSQKDKTFKLSYYDNILTLKILELKFDDESIDILINSLDCFHKWCQTNNTYFYSLIDLRGAYLINVHNYIYYSPQIIRYINSQETFLDKYLYGIIYIINNNTVKKILTNMISYIKLVSPVKIILKNEEVDFTFAH
tara:strand:+ start:663 stop:1082 length:420 start_codon:yes stop_codon:yes gene_type:complete